MSLKDILLSSLVSKIKVWNIKFLAFKLYPATLCPNHIDHLLIFLRKKVKKKNIELPKNLEGEEIEIEIPTINHPKNPSLALYTSMLQELSN